MFPTIGKRLLVLCALLTSAAGCSSSKVVQVPPRMDLRGYGTIGLVTFHSDTEEGISRQAGREFLGSVQSAQPGVAVLELDGDAMGAFGPGTVNAEAIRALGRKHGVDAILFGVLEAEAVRPRARVGPSIESLTAAAEVRGTLTARLFDTRSGATAWSTIARGKETVARVTLSGDGVSGIGGTHPDEARERLVTSLVSDATRDFRPTWVRQRQ